MFKQRPRSAFYWLATHPKEGSPELRAEMRELQKQLRARKTKN